MNFSPRRRKRLELAATIQRRLELRPVVVLEGVRIDARRLSMPGTLVGATAYARNQP